MNFMPGRPGFYEEVNASRSSSSSPSSSYLRHRTVLPPYTYGGVPPLPQPTLLDSGGGEDETPDESSDDHNMLFRAAAGGGGEGSSAAPVLSIQREHMFDKVVTPSDVGKLNRLVIPKQHAEKYFPLDSSTNEKGLLLNFEDRNGKPWRFRYSYWNSSQSYVMTKGWSRFVKEKKLDPGDIVSFQRGVGEVGKDRLFIDWRRRPDALPPDPPHALSIPLHQFSFHRQPPPPSQSVVNPWGGPPLYMQPTPSRDHLYSNFLQPTSNNAVATPLHHPYPAAYGNIVNGNPCPPGSIMYLRSSLGVCGGVRDGVWVPGGQNRGPYDGIDDHNEQRMVFESVPVVQGKAAAKRLRLFGVNMDCPISDSSDDNIINECDFLLSSSAAMPLPPPPQFHDSMSLASLRSNEDDEDDVDDKGKGFMSLDI